MGVGQSQQEVGLRQQGWEGVEWGLKWLRECLEGLRKSLKEEREGLEEQALQEGGRLWDMVGCWLEGVQCCLGLRHPLACLVDAQEPGLGLLQCWVRLRVTMRCH